MASIPRGLEAQLAESWSALGRGKGSLLVFSDPDGGGFSEVLNLLPSLDGFASADFLRFSPLSDRVGPFSPLFEAVAPALRRAPSPGSLPEELELYPRHRPLWRALIEGEEPLPLEPVIDVEIHQERIFLRRDMARLCARAGSGSRVVVACDRAELLPQETLEALEKGDDEGIGPILILLCFGDRPGKDDRDETWAGFFNERLSHGRILLLGESEAVPAELPASRLEPRDLPRLMAFLHYGTCARAASRMIQAWEHDPSAAPAGDRRLVLETLALSRGYLGEVDTALISAQTLQAETAARDPASGRRHLQCILASLFKSKNDPETAIRTAVSAWRELDLDASDAERAEVEFALYLLKPRNGTYPEIFDGLEERAIPLFEKLEWKNHLTMMLSQAISVTDTYDRRGVEAAEEQAQRGLRLARESGNLRAMGTSLQTIGLLADKRGSRAEAEKAYLEAREVRVPIARDFELARNDNGLGYFYFLSGDYQKAFKRHAQALQYLYRSRQYEETMGTLFNLCRVYLVNGQPAEGLFCMESLLKIRDKLGIDDIPFHSNRNIYSLAGLCCLKLGRISQALEFGRRIAELAPQSAESYGTDHELWFECDRAWLCGAAEEAARRFSESAAAMRRRLADSRQVLFLVLMDAASFARSAGDAAAERSALGEALALYPEEESHQADKAAIRALLDGGEPPARPPFPRVSFEPDILLQFVEQDYNLKRLQRKINELGFLKAWDEALRNAGKPDLLFERTMALLGRHFLIDDAAYYAVACPEPGTKPTEPRLSLVLGRPKDPEAVAAYLDGRLSAWGAKPSFWEGNGDATAPTSPWSPSSASATSSG